MLDAILLRLRKSSQKSTIRSVVGQTLTIGAQSEIKKTHKAVKNQSLIAKANMTRITNSLSDSVRGEFGTEVRKTFEKQTDRVDELI